MYLLACCVPIDPFSHALVLDWPHACLPRATASLHGRALSAASNGFCPGKPDYVPSSAVLQCRNSIIWSCGGSIVLLKEEGGQKGGTKSRSYYSIVRLSLLKSLTPTPIAIVIHRHTRYHIIKRVVPCSITSLLASQDYCFRVVWFRDPQSRITT
jgi:hypothetical protein